MPNRPQNGQNETKNDNTTAKAKSCIQGRQKAECGQTKKQ